MIVMVAKMLPWNSNPGYYYLTNKGDRLGSIRFRNGEWTMWKCEPGCEKACVDQCQMLNDGRKAVPDKEVS